MNAGRRRLGLAAYVCTDPGVPAFGNKGSSVHVQAVLTELARRSDEVHLLTTRPGGPPPPALAGVHVHAFARPDGHTAQREAALVALDGDVAERLAEVGTRRTPTVVYQRYSLWSCAPMELAARHGWASVLEINAPLVEEQSRHRQLVDRPTAIDRTRRAAHAATHPIAVTPAVAEWAQRVTGRPAAVVPNGVDPSRFRPRFDSAAERRDTVTIGFVGTFKPWHDLDTIVATIARLRDAPGIPPLRVMLIGDGPERSRILARLATMGLGDAVDAPGAVAPGHIPALLDRMDIAVAPYSTTEQYFSPLKVFEYLAAGVAVVASRIDGLGDLLRHGHEALLVSPGDTDAFVAAVRRLCVDATARETIARAGRTAAVSRFGWGRTVDRILTALADRQSA